MYGTFKAATGFQTGRILEVISDLRTTWYMLIVVAVIALVIGYYFNDHNVLTVNRFIYLYLIKYCAGVLVWGVIVLSVLLLFGTSFVCIKPVDEE
jgi:hypothetical protein